MAPPVPSRRRFLLALIAGLAALAGLRRFLKPRPAPQAILVDTPLSTIPRDGALVFGDERVAVGWGKDGIFALSLVCTHLGCTVSVTSEGIFCPCHGSRFDREGRVVRGPADRPLPRLTAEIRNNRLIVSK